jgi:hypothetical protein
MACRRRRPRRGKACITFRLKSAKVTFNFALAFHAAVTVLQRIGHDSFVVKGAVRIDIHRLDR